MIRVVARAILLLLCAPSLSRAADPPAPSVQVETVSPRQQLLKRTVEGYGSVASSEDTLFDVSFLHAGQVAQLLVRLGETVKTGQKLLVLSADPAALLSYQRAAGTLDFAKRDLARTKSLAAQHLATNAQVAAARKAVQDAANAVETERKLGNDRPTETATAPFDGYVAGIAVAPGDRVQANMMVLKLARTDRIRVTAGLQPEDAAHVQIGMKAEVVPVFGSGRALEGSVHGLGGTINPVTRLVDVWIALPAAPAELVPGSATSVRIVLEEHMGWVVPRDAVLRDGNNVDYVFQVVGNTARRLAVKTGVQTDKLTEIIGPIAAGQKIVTLGNYELQDGMTVREAAAK